MTNTITDYAAYYEELAQENDHSISGGSFTRELPPEGKSTARLVEVVELGQQLFKGFKGKEDSYHPAVNLGFELLGKKWEIITEDGKRIPNIIRTNKMKLSTDDRASFKKLFCKMAGKSGVKSIYSMIGKEFLITIEHNTSEDGKKTYANMKNKVEGWLIGDAVIEVADEEGNITAKALKVPAANVEPLVFSWNRPLKEMWDRLKIEGENDDGDSKNFIQDMMLTANNFQGSELQALLAGFTDTNKLEDLVAENAEVEEVEEVEEAPAPKKTRKAKAKKAVVETVVEDEVVDAPAKSAPVVEEALETVSDEAEYTDAQKVLITKYKALGMTIKQMEVTGLLKV